MENRRNNRNGEYNNTSAEEKGRLNRLDNMDEYDNMDRYDAETGTMEKRKGMGKNYNTEAGSYNRTETTAGNYNKNNNRAKNTNGSSYNKTK